MISDLSIGIRREVPWTSPVFVGDGIGETYLYPTYRGGLGRAAIEIQDFFLSLNYQQPGP